MKIAESMSESQEDSRWLSYLGGRTSEILLTNFCLCLFVTPNPNSGSRDFENRTILSSTFFERGHTVRIPTLDVEFGFWISSFLISNPTRRTAHESILICGLCENANVRLLHRRSSRPPFTIVFHHHFFTQAGFYASSYILSYRWCE